ncbi:MAG: hypothetical protein VX834_10965, partial [Myxococcota bacterium]|nr:hypothetical protein [Myxococcota bacterium]
MLRTALSLTCVAFVSLMIPACSGTDGTDTACENGFDCYGEECADLTTVGDGNCDAQNLCDMLDNDGGDCGDVDSDGNGTDA